MDNATPTVIQNPPVDTSSMVPMGQGEGQQGAPSTSSGETPQNSAEGADQSQTPQGKSDEGERLLAGKFKSPEELEKSYLELQSHNTKVEMERADLEKLFTQAQTTTETKEVSQPEEEQPIAPERLQPAVNQEISKLLAPVLTKLEIQDMINKYGDKFVAVAKDVKKIKDEKNISMEDAFKLATYPGLERTSYTQGVQRANAVNEQKQKAVVESSRPSGYRSASLEDAVKDPNVSVSEIAESVPELKAFAEISKRKQALFGRK